MYRCNGNVMLVLEFLSGSYSNLHNLSFLTCSFAKLDAPV